MYEFWIGIGMLLLGCVVQQRTLNQVRVAQQQRNWNDNRASRLLISSIGIGSEILAIWLLPFQSYAILCVLHVIFHHRHVVKRFYYVSEKFGLSLWIIGIVIVIIVPIQEPPLMTFDQCKTQLTITLGVCFGLAFVSRFIKCIWRTQGARLALLAALISIACTFLKLAGNEALTSLDFDSDFSLTFLAIDCFIWIVLILMSGDLLDILKEQQDGFVVACQYFMYVSVLETNIGIFLLDYPQLEEALNIAAYLIALLLVVWGVYLFSYQRIRYLEAQETPVKKRGEVEAMRKKLFSPGVTPREEEMTHRDQSLDEFTMDDFNYGRNNDENNI